MSGARYQIVDVPDDYEWRWIHLRKRVAWWWWSVDRWPYKVEGVGRQRAVAKAYAAMGVRLRGTEGGNVVHDTHPGGVGDPGDRAGALTLGGDE